MTTTTRPMPAKEALALLRSHGRRALQVPAPAGTCRTCCYRVDGAAVNLGRLRELATAAARQHAAGAPRTTALGAIRAAAEAPLSAGDSRPLVAQGLVWAEASARIDGTLSLALQQGTAEAGEALLNAAMAGEAGTMAEASSWLIEHREEALRILRG